MIMMRALDSLLWTNSSESGIAATPTLIHFQMSLWGGAAGRRSDSD